LIHWFSNTISKEGFRFKSVKAMRLYSSAFSITSARTALPAASGNDPDELARFFGF
jgi:hypothetical protein